jgi:hypothetical protein
MWVCTPDARAVPEVDGVVAAQEHVFVAFAAVPPVLKDLGRGGVPHDEAGAARAPGDEVLHVAVVAGKGCIAVVG